MWKITKDHINTDEFNISRKYIAGYTSNVGLGPIAPEVIDLPNKEPLIPFRLKDDDGEVYYEGELNDDSGECLNQQAALEYGMRDAGCTTIEVKRGRKWVQEIG
jgi:hypothetical protein